MEIETSPAKFEALLAGLGNRECFLVLCLDGSVEGYGVVKAYSDRIGYRVAAETSIYLRRSRAGEGLGARLQKALLEKCREFQYHHVVAKIWASNEASIRFHQRFGFELVGIQREIGYLAGAWMDVAILQLILSDVSPYRPEIR
jgi:phosphinothricin acetyltransferase